MTAVFLGVTVVIVVGASIGLYKLKKWHIERQIRKLNEGFE